VHAVPGVVPPLAAVSTNWPVDCVQAPAVPNRFDVDDTVSFAAFAVCEPVSATIVTVDPAGKLQLAINVTDNVTREPATGVLCPIVLTLNDGTTTFIGVPPSITPYMSAVSVVMVTVVSDTVPDAAMFTVAPFCAAKGFVTWNENIYSADTTTVWPVCTVRVNVPELQAPLRCVAPSENRLAPLFATSVRVT